MHIENGLLELCKTLCKKLAADTRSQSEIARVCGVSQPVISRLLAEQFATMKAANIDKIATLYGIDARVVLQEPKPAKRRG